MTYSIRVANSFERDVRKLGHRNQDRVWKLLKEIQEALFVQIFERAAFCYEVSENRDLRILHVVEENAKRIVLIRVGHRESVYE